MMYEDDTEQCYLQPKGKSDGMAISRVDDVVIDLFDGWKDVHNLGPIFISITLYPILES